MKLARDPAAFSLPPYGESLRNGSLLSQAARVYRPSRRRVDAVAWTPSTYFIIESKVRDPAEGMGWLITYLSEANKTPDLPNYTGQEIKGRLVVPFTIQRDREMAAEFGDSPFALVTLHRAETVDDPDRLHALIATLSEIGRRLAVLFPVHPRTRKVMEDHRITVGDERLRLLEPLGYVDFLALESRATLVITDSGGVQEESTYLGIPCLTARERTERPVTVDVGTNTLVGYDMDELRNGVDTILSGDYKSGSIPPLWDGHAAERVADAVC